MLVAVCLECDEHFELEDETDVEEIVTCPKCGTRYEVLDLDPVVVDYAEQKVKR